MYSDNKCNHYNIINDLFSFIYYIINIIIITERLSEPVIIQDLHQSHPDLRWRNAIQAVDGGVLAVYEDSDNRYNLIKIDQEGKIINKLYVTDKYIRGLIWEEPDLYVLLSGGYIVHVREGGVIKQHKINDARWLSGGAVDKDDILAVDDSSGLSDGRVMSYNVQTGQKDIKLQGLQLPQSITKTVYNNQVLYLITEWEGHYVSVYNSSWIKQKTIGSR